MLVNLIMYLDLLAKENEDVMCIGALVAVPVLLTVICVDSTAMYPRGRLVTWFTRIGYTGLFIFLPVALALCVASLIAEQRPESTWDIVRIVLSD
jgi:hypothetical protein